MDLPTYTNIWRIEKRLYKLYDFRLPAPLPINWIAVFTGITVPYIVLLIAIGLPFNHTLVWLYVLPPGVLTWLTTRPVIENKRLPELLESQIRYLTEPRVWCRLAPLTEKDQIAVTARVWHSRRVPRQRREAKEAAPGAVTLREPGTLVRRTRGPAIATATATQPSAAPTAPTAASTAASTAAGAVRQEPARPGSARQRVRARASAAGAPGTIPVAASRARSADQRPAAERRPAATQAPIVNRPPAVGQVLPAGQGPAAPIGWTVPQPPADTPVPKSPADTPVPTRAQPPADSRAPVVAGSPADSRGAGPAQTPVGTRAQPPGEPPAAKPGRFRLAALRSKPSGPPPALPPGVVLKPPASPWPARQADPAPPPSRTGPAGPRPAAGPAAPAPSHGLADPRPSPGPDQPAWPHQPGFPQGMPPARSAPSLRPVAAPVPSGMPAHATPDVYPVAPPRERSRGLSAPHIEVSHGPSQRLTPPAPPATPPQTPPPATSAPVEDPDTPTEAPPSQVATPDAPASATPPVSLARPAVPAGSAEATALPEITPAEAITAAAAKPPVESVRAEVKAPREAIAPAVEVTPPVELSTTQDLFADSSAIAPEMPNKAPDVAAAPQIQHGPPSPVVTAVADSEHQKVPSIERALSGPSRDRNLSWHGKVKIVAGATQGPGARDQEALDRARARLPLNAPKRVVMLGCTSGAGQTVTALMTGYILASLREQPVAAVDLHDGSLARYSAPAGWLEEILGGMIPQPLAPARPDGLNPTHRDGPARLDVIASHEALKDGDERRLAEHLGRHYALTMLDPGAAGLTKLLTVADQLVVVVPASVEAAGSLADTRDWLDAHGFADLASHSVTLINGVSRRTMPDVAQAEAVARGRCRAIVRVPWDDMLPVGVTGPSTLRPQTRVAYTALAGVLVAGMAAAPIRKKQ